MRSTNNRVLSLDITRIAAVLAVVMIHASACFITESKTAYEFAVGNIFDTISRIGVPLFIMISGALMLDEHKHSSVNLLLKKNIKNLVFLLVFWSAVYDLIYHVFLPLINHKAINLKEIMIAFTHGHIHMWYLYMLVGLYLLLPFYRKIAKYSDRWEIKFLLSIYFIFISLLPLTGMLELKSGFYIHVSTIYPLYLFCGYAIHKKFFEINKLTSVLLILLSTEGIFLLTIIRWKYSVEVMEQLWSYSSILVVMQAVGVFTLMVRTKGNVWKLAGKILNKIDDCSFGIYLIHMIFVRLVLRYMEYNPYEGIVPLNFILLICGILAVSYVITWVMKKVPGIRSII